MLDCLNLVQHLQPRCLEDRFLPQQTRKKVHTVTSRTHQRFQLLERSLALLPVGVPFEELHFSTFLHFFIFHFFIVLHVFIFSIFSFLVFFHVFVKKLFCIFCTFISIFIFSSSASHLHSDRRTPKTNTHSSPLNGVHLLAKEIRRKMTAQRCPSQLLVLKEPSHMHASCAHNVQEKVQDTVFPFPRQRRLGYRAATASEHTHTHDNQRAQTCTFEGPGLQKHHQNSTKGPTTEEEKNENFGGRREKKCEVLGVQRRGSTGGWSSGGGSSGALRVWGLGFRVQGKDFWGQQQKQNKKKMKSKIRNKKKKN